MTWQPIETLTYGAAKGRVLLICAPSLYHADWNPEGTAQATFISDEPGDVLVSVKWNGSHDCWESVEVSDATEWMLLPLPTHLLSTGPEIEPSAKLPPEVLEVLGFYADPQSYADGPSLSDVAWVPDIAVLSDRGKRAEAALKHYRKGEAA